jgi:excisionase family DNA binding protein
VLCPASRLTTNHRQQQETDNVTTKEVKRKRFGQQWPEVPDALKLGRDIFSVGEIAVRCGVSTRTVQKWCDSGSLPCYRIPGVRSGQPGDRRVHKADLIAFLKHWKMRVPADLEDQSPRLLLVATDTATVAATGTTTFDVRHVADAYTAGVTVSQWRPAVIVVDLSIGTSNAASMGRAIREAQTDAWTPRLIALGGDDADPTPLTAAGFDVVLSQGDDAALVKTIREAV